MFECLNIFMCKNFMLKNIRTDEVCVILVCLIMSVHTFNFCTATDV